VSDESEIPKGSVAAGTRVRLPPGAEPPIRVYINGVPQQEGRDYRVERGHVVFPRQIVKEQVSGGRWLAMFLGLFGSYGKHEVVDVEYRRGDRTELVSDARILA
jgi:hypothetical protein